MTAIQTSSTRPSLTHPYGAGQLIRRPSPNKHSTLPAIRNCPPVDPAPDPSVVNNIALNNAFDRMCASLFSFPLHEAVQSSLSELLSAQSTTLWVLLGDQRSLYSPGLSKICASLPSIVSTVFEQNESLFLEKPSIHASFNRTVDAADIPSYYFPLTLLDGTVVAVIQAIGITSAAASTADAFATKFVSYAHLLFTPVFVGQLTSQLCVPVNPMAAIVDQLKNFFKCREVDLFRTNSNDKIEIFDFTTNKFEERFDTAGAADFSLKHQAPLNLSNVLRAPGYSSEVDGTRGEPILVAPLCGGTAIAVRGKTNGKPFTGTDMASLFAITPYIYRGLTSGDRKSVV
jgi:hypothetical protein